MRGWLARFGDMRVLFDEPVHVHYGFLWFDSQQAMELPDLMETRGGQANGLLGAAVAGVLSMVTGTHTGAVRVRVEQHDQRPGPPDDGYQDVVEASWVPRGPDTTLSSFDYNWELVVAPVVQYRARWCAADMDYAREHEHDEDHPDVSADRYLLQLWPQSVASDVVVRVGSQAAAYWHGEAAKHAAPMAPFEVALAEQREALAERERRAGRLRQQQLDAWGGAEPSARLVQVGGVAQQLARRDRRLVDAIVAAGPSRQRLLAVEMARLVTASAQAAAPTGLNWQPAIVALSAGVPLPAPFDNDYALRDAVFPPDPQAVGTAVTVGIARLVPVQPRPAQDPRICAITVVRAAAAEDPLRAALDAVEAASWAAVTDSAFLRDVAEFLERT